MTYEKIDHCPICERDHFKNYIITRDYLLTGESFAIVECSNCGLRLTNPRPPKDEIGKYYQSDAYISHTNKGTSLINVVYKVARHFTIRSKIKLITSYAKDKTVLDFGSGTGHFLRKCSDYGWDATGIEPGKNARELSENLRDTLVFSHLSDLPPKKEFEIITMWHVLEHVHDLNDTLSELRKRLKKKGSMFVALPNCSSWDATYYKESWAGYDVPRHLYHFTPETFKQLVAKHDMTVKRIVPQKLDAYYVSLLSDKYLNDRVNYLRSLNKGFLSNRKAIKSNLFSSIIYIINR